MQTTTTTRRRPICQNLETSEATDYVCTLDRGHAGSCDFTDAMGMCQVNEDCRALRNGNNGHEHNHPAISATVPFPVDYPNRPWSLPPCQNPDPSTGAACTMGAHTIRNGVREHAAQVKDPYIRWVGWHTTDPA